MSGFFTGVAPAAEVGGPWGAAIAVTIGVIATGIATAVGMITGSHDKGSSGTDDDDNNPSGKHDPDDDIIYHYNGMHISDANEIGYHEIQTRRQRLFIKSYLKKIGTALAVAVPTYVGRRRLARSIHNWRHGDDTPHTPLPDQILRATGLHRDPFGTPPRRKRYREFEGFRYRPH